MIRELVDRLLKVEADLVVTVTAPLDRRRPRNDEDRIRFRNLLIDAHHRVLAVRDDQRARALLDHMDAAAADVELGAGAHGVVVVATSEMAEAHLLPFPVSEAVALGTTAATRSLVQGLVRTPRYRVLVLSDRATRLYEAVRDDLVEVLDHGFRCAAMSCVGIAGRSPDPSRCRPGAMIANSGAAFTETWIVLSRRRAATTWYRSS